MRVQAIAQRFFAALFMLLFACENDAPNTQIRVIIDSDLAVGSELTKLQVRVFDREGKEELRRQDFALGERREGARFALPMSFKLAPESQRSSTDFRLVVTGIGPLGPGGSDIEVVEQQALASFRPREALRLDIFLGRSCLLQLCREDSEELSSLTCDIETGACVEVPTRTDLPAVTGDGIGQYEQEKGSAGVGADFDAGREGGSDEAAVEEEDGEFADEVSGDENDAALAGDGMIAADGPMQCPAGSRPVDSTCSDIDECKDALLPFPCDTAPLAACSDTVGSFTCACPTGFVGDGKGAQGCLPALAGLTVAGATLSPPFDPLVTEYSAHVALWRASAALTPSAQPGHSLDLDGARVASGNSFTKALVPGTNRAQIVVNAGGDSRTYAVTLTRGEPIEDYLKASNSGARDYFGSIVSLSADGTTLAVGAPEEDSLTRGIGSTPNDDGAETGAVYVFRRSGSTWVQEAYIKASNAGAGDEFGRSVSLSGDGNTLAVGAWLEDSSTTGVNTVPDEAAEDSGAAYIFRRTGTSWRQEAYLKARNTGVQHGFGAAISLSADASFVAVGAAGEASTMPGINPDPNEAGRFVGAVYLFYYNGANWGGHTYVKAGNPGDADYFGVSVALNADATTLVVGAHREASSSSGVNSVPNEAAGGAGAAYVFRRSGAVWSQEAYLKASNPSAEDNFGFRVAVSADGSRVVVGAPGEASSTSGIDSVPDEGATAAGAAYVYRRTNGSWAQDAYLKALNSGPKDTFGVALSMSADGNLLAVGASGEASSTPGVNAPPNEAALYSGAVYLFRHSGSSWSQEVYLKAFNAGMGNNFGYSVALSATGAMLAVGSAGEASSTTGVGSVPDRAAPGAGAVYVYH